MWPDSLQLFLVRPHFLKRKLNINVCNLTEIMYEVRNVSGTANEDFEANAEKNVLNNMFLNEILI